MLVQKPKQIGKLEGYQRLIQPPNQSRPRTLHKPEAEARKPLFGGDLPALPPSTFCEAAEHYQSENCRGSGRTAATRML